MKSMEIATKVNQIILGLVMLVPGLFKLFVMGPSAVVTMLSGIGFPAPTLFAWLLILSEIGFGAAVLLGWKLQYTTIVPAIILVIAGFSVYMTQYPTLLLHLACASNFIALGCMHCKKK